MLYSIDPAAFRIIVHPFTGVGILMFSIELVKQGKTDGLFLS